MNAHEAIELNINELNRLKIKKENMEYIRETHTDDYKHLCNDIKALSMIIESAKLVHEYFENSDLEYDERDSTMGVEQIRFDDPLYIDEEVSKRIGYQLDTDYEWVNRKGASK